MVTELGLVEELCSDVGVKRRIPEELESDRERDVSRDAKGEVEIGGRSVDTARKGRTGEMSGEGAVTDKEKKRTVEGEENEGELSRGERNAVEL